MHFGGIQKNSFIDYPGKISCVLFVAGCNFTCPYCHNPVLAAGRPVYPLKEKDAYEFLHQRKGFLEGVVISGGEPTLTPNIFRICHTIQSLGYPIKLDTNGSRPQILNRLLNEGLVDYVAMDVKTDPQEYGPPLAPTGIASSIISSIELLLTGDIPYEFRTTCVAPFISLPIIKRIGHWIRGAQRYFLQPFRPDTVLSPDFFKGNLSATSNLNDLRAAVTALVPSCQLRL